MTNRNIDILIAFVMFAFGVLVLALAGSIRLGGVVGVVGPKFFPQILAMIIMSMSVLLAISSWVHRQQGPSESVTTKPASDATSERFLRIPAVRVTMLLCLISGYVFALDLLGYRLGSVLFIGVLLLFKGMRSPVWVGVASVTLTLILYLLFHVLLSIPLPVGSFTDVR